MYECLKGSEFFFIFIIYLQTLVSTWYNLITFVVIALIFAYLIYIQCQRSVIFFCQTSKINRFIVSEVPFILFNAFINFEEFIVLIVIYKFLQSWRIFRALILYSFIKILSQASLKKVIMHLVQKLFCRLILVILEIMMN